MTQCEPVAAQSNLKDDCGCAAISTGSTTAIAKVRIFLIMNLFEYTKK